MTNGAERLALIRTQNTLSRILYDKQLVAIGDVHNSIHVARDTGIMHRDNYLGFLRNSPFDGIRINIHSSRADVNEHQGGTNHLKRRGSGRKSEARQNDLITRM